MLPGEHPAGFWGKRAEQHFGEAAVERRGWTGRVAGAHKLHAIPRLVFDYWW